MAEKKKGFEAFAIRYERATLLATCREFLADLEIIRLAVWSDAKIGRFVASNMRRIFASQHGSPKLRERLAASLLAKLPEAFEERNRLALLDV